MTHGPPYAVHSGAIPCEGVRDSGVVLRPVYHGTRAISMIHVLFHFRGAHTHTFTLARCLYISYMCRLECPSQRARLASHPRSPTE
eukprot:14270638-Alexandrium_andersonii.AAC.1